MQLYSTSSGELRWVTENSGDQSWCATSSPDSKHAVLGSAGGWTIQVHSVESGELTSKFPESFNDRCRCLAWKDGGEQLALCVSNIAYVWRPFDGPSGTVIQRFQIGGPEIMRPFCTIQKFGWMSNGQSLYLQMSEGTRLIYHPQTNAKELLNDLLE